MNLQIHQRHTCCFSTFPGQLCNWCFQQSAKMKHLWMFFLTIYRVIMWATATAYVIFHDCINCRVISQLVNELASIELKMKFRQVSGFYIVDDTVINCLPFISQVQKVNSLGKIQFTKLYFIFLIYKIFITFTICSCKTQMRKMTCDRRCVQVKTNTAAQ